jgi:uncharacterized protein
MHIELSTLSQATRRGVKLGVGIALVALQLQGGLMSSAQAASFKCGKHLSASEKIVCDDPELSKLDDKLAADYQRALDAAVDKAAIEADRTQQWAWRQHNCTDAQCVKGWYERRIGELEADYTQGQHAQREAFEHDLADQHLAPSAQSALRELKHVDDAQ